MSPSLRKLRSYRKSRHSAVCNSRCVRRPIIVLTLGLALSGCTSSAVGGHGSAAPGAATPATTPVTTTSAPPSAPGVEPSSGPGTPTSAPDPNLNCPAGAISATGAPFCYPLPRGFSDFSAQNNYGTGWTYKTLVSLGGHDLIEVLGGVYPNDTDSMTADRLRQFFNRSGRLQKGELGIVHAGQVRPTRVAGHRGFVQTGRYRNGVRTVDTRVYAGRSVVAIYCQSKTRKPQVTQACAEVRNKIHIAQL